MTLKGQKQREYSEEDIITFLTLAQTEGLTRTIRELGYPSYNTALRWAKDRGVDTSTGTLMEIARKAHKFYETEDLVQTTDEIIERIKHDLIEKQDLDADSVNKLVNSFTKAVTTWQTLQGKAASISETRTGDATDTHIANLINQFKQNDRETTSSSEKSN